MIPFRVYVLLDSQAFMDIPVHFVKLTAPMRWANDHWSDDHMGTVVMHVILSFNYAHCSSSWLDHMAVNYECKLLHESESSYQEHR